MHPIAERAVETNDPIRVLVEEFFGKNGPLLERGWDVRASQRDMAMHIAWLLDNASADPSWEGVEAPCGTGKGLAYLVPGVLATLRAQDRWSKMEGEKPPYFPKLVISTAGIPLQRQLHQSDVPAIAKMLDIELKSMVVKGRNNYACMKAIADDIKADKYGAGARVYEWLRNGGSGDREDLPWDPGATWANVSVASDQCAEKACAHFAYTGRRLNEDGHEADLCYWRRAVHGWKSAHVMILNHHYLALAGAMRTTLLAVDEAHELEDAVRSTHTEMVHEGSARGAARLVQRWLDKDEAEARVIEPVQRLMNVVTGLVTKKTAGKPGDVLPLDEGWLNADRVKVVQDSLDGVVDQIRGIAVGLGAYDTGERLIAQPNADQETEDEQAHAVRAHRAVESLRNRVVGGASGKGMDSPDGPWAVYAERQKHKDGTRDVLHMAPADISQIVAELRLEYPIGVLTSATMPADRPMQMALGLPDKGKKDDAGSWRGIVRLPSPFPLHRMGLLVVPEGAPDPKGDAWPDWAVDRVVEAVKLSGGGALILSSSYRMMERYADALRERLPNIPVKRQGDAGREELRTWFKEDIDGVLVATRSFFTGVDVSGDACRLVLIDRIPFGRPDDPVEQTVCAHLEDIARESGKKSSGFDLRTIPSAAMVLAQGAGRLIRCATDRGAVVVLDRRILDSKGCWKVLRLALPAFPDTRNMGLIPNILGRTAAAREART